MDRRALVQWLVATGGMAAFHRLSAHDVETIGRDVHRRVAQQVSESNTGADASDAQPARGRALNGHAAATVAAAAERIIPASDTPGATDARVTSFIDTMMTDWYSAAERDRFVRGLDELDERSRAQHGRVFVDVPVASQVTLLETVDTEVTALRTARGASANEHWFAMLKYLTVWGYCTSEAGMRRTLKSYPPPMRYDGAAPVRAS